MGSFSSRLFRAISPPPSLSAPEWAVPTGRRIYAIGDVHGRFDLLRQLLAMIKRDHAARPAARKSLVFLGDLVDRGPQSRDVIEHLIALSESGEDCLFLTGNHDETFIRAAEGGREAASRLHRMGGRDTALSYGITADEYDRGSFGDLATLLRERVPREHVAFLKSFRDWTQIGDYVFVHAGIRPGLSMDEQLTGDLRWIHSGFREYAPCHGVMIVHGHTITDEPDMASNRIGIDTGAFRSGKLTALGLESTERWTMCT